MCHLLGSQLHFVGDAGGKHSEEDGKEGREAVKRLVLNLFLYMPLLSR